MAAGRRSVRMTNPNDSTVAHLLSAIPEDQRDKLFKMLKDGPAVLHELTGNRQHRSCLHRWESKGIAGVRLQTVTVGRTRFTSRRMLLNFFAETDAARRARKEPQPPPRRATRGATRRRDTRMTDEETEAILERHGLGRNQRKGR